MSELRSFIKDSKEFEFYLDMHRCQSLKLAREKCETYKLLKKRKMSIKQALQMLDDFVDPSDPDLDVQNSVHAYQTAERIRRAHPENKALQVVGLIHDVGKVLFSFGEPIWAVVGDTYVLGCAFPDSIVYSETMRESPDYGIQDYSTPCGIYKPNCGLDALTIAFGHDEYLYWVLKGNQNKNKHFIGDSYLNIIRYHSLYPWHTGDSYKHLMDDLGKDEETLANVRMFNAFDLYSKEDATSVSHEVKQYYDSLLDEFFTEELDW